MIFPFSFIASSGSTPPPGGLVMQFSYSIPVANPTDVAEWNTFFDLPANGTPFTSVAVGINNDIHLYGSTGINLKSNLFFVNDSLRLIDDSNSLIVNVVNDNTFSNCYSLQTVILPNVTSVGISGFDSCNNLITVDLSKTITIESNAFSFCQNLSSISLPLVTSINDYAFQFCYGLQNINLPLVTYIGDYCFQYCYSLQNINLPSLINLGSSVYNNNIFDSVSGQIITMTVSPSILTCNGGNPDGDIQYLKSSNTVTIVPVFPDYLHIRFNQSLPIPANSPVSAWNTFFNLPVNGTPFTSVSYPTLGYNEVKLFGGGNINISPNLFQGYYFYFFKDYLGVITSIGNDAFNQFDIQEEIYLPNVITIGNSSFANSTASSFNFSLVQTIGQSCFANNVNLTTINLPAVTNLGGTVGNNNVFNLIIGKTINLIVPPNLMTCNAGAPDGDIQYLQANNTVTVSTVPLILKYTSGAILFNTLAEWNTFFNLPTDGTPFTNISIDNLNKIVKLYGATSINLKDQLFYDNTNIVEIDDSASLIVNTIGSGCFIRCSFLTTINLPLVTHILDTGIADCPILTTVTLPNLISIADFGFIRSVVHTIDFPNLTTVGQYAFYASHSYVVNLPNLTTLGYQAFVDSLNISTFNLPSLISTGSYAFAGTRAIEYNFPALTTLGFGAFTIGTFPSLLNSTILLPAVTNLGGSVGNNNVFYGVIGKTIALTIPSAIMTCNGGNPDGDVQYLQANNTVTITTV